MVAAGCLLVHCWHVIAADLVEYDWQTASLRFRPLHVRAHIGEYSVVVINVDVIRQAGRCVLWLSSVVGLCQFKRTYGKMLISAREDSLYSRT